MWHGAALAPLARDGALSDPPALLTLRKPLAKCARLVGELERAHELCARSLVEQQLLCRLCHSRQHCFCANREP